MTPEEALEEARRRVAAARERGLYGDDLQGVVIEPTDRIGIELLFEWAVLEPDLDEVRSTRRLGGPITWVKRLMIRGMRQYLGQIIAHQTRFNLNVMVRMTELEDRVKRLEEWSSSRS